MQNPKKSEIGIAAIATFEPPWQLSNDWYGDTIPGKFVRQTGIEARHISLEDEVAMALHAAKKLRQETACDWRDCAGIIFTSPSFVPIPVAKKFCDSERVKQEFLPSAARRFAEGLGIANRSIHAVNWFCSGYAKAMKVAFQRRDPAPELLQNQFLLLVTTSRISRITDYRCKSTAALFGDMATATMISRTDCQRYSPRFQILFADAKRFATDGAYFDFHCRDNVISPKQGGQQQTDRQRVVFSLNGMGIADAAPRAMSKALSEACAATGLQAEELRFVIPHQAGTGIIRLAAMKMEEAGVKGQVVNAIATQVGNVSSCSIPYALKMKWDELDGLIACPTAAVGQPGKPEMSQGCIVLKTLPVKRAVTPAFFPNITSLTWEAAPNISW